jgi:hypothetical protein
MNLYMMKLRAGDFEHDAEEAGVSADVQEALDELEKSRDDKLEAGAEEGFHNSIKSGTALYKRYYRWPTGWSCVLKSSRSYLELSTIQDMRCQEITSDVTWVLRVQRCWSVRFRR